METLRLRIVAFESCPSLDTAAREELRELNIQLLIVKVVLLDAAKTTIHGQLVQGWLNCIEKILQGADDLMVKLHGETLQSNMKVENNIIKRYLMFFQPMPACI